MANIISLEVISAKIFFVRGKRVMLDRDLAMLYGVPVRVLNQAVKRNLKRFPGDFMYRLRKQEVVNLKSQFGVGLINFVDNVCRYRLTPFVSGLKQWSTAKVTLDWKRNGCGAINLG